MANGLLGKAMASATVPVTVYTVPNDVLFATVSMNLVNGGVTDANVKISMTTSPTPGAMDYIETNAVIPANGGSLERTCMPMSADEKLVVESTSADVAIRVYGLEQEASA